VEFDLQDWCLLWMKYRNISHWTRSLVDQLADVKEFYLDDQGHMSLVI